MLGRLFRWGVFLGLVGLGAFWFVTMPQSVSDGELTGLTADAAAGQQVFTAAGCASCHAAPKTEAGDKLVLTGGQTFPSPFGTFTAPNISQDPDHGIGGWSASDLASAVIKGTSPDGQHYFPAFPYASYAKMTPQDAVNLHAYMQTLPADATPSQPHDIGFPFNIRRTLGGWKMLFVSESWVLDTDDPQLQRGRYLVEALGHCAECHTPRNALGGLQKDNWMQGAPDPSGKGRIPGVTPAILGWSQADIAEYLNSGFTPEFDTAGGHMVEVVENTAQLTQEDREAIAAYLMALPN
ncbi:cytochrome c [uncultured Litoreibacter sp.]|uniref:c-type cytochrome n=1 Tax=uncultured Litoreibacter sp. TaxID=1392394 RepID=UPI0026327172|nr:cytochrome c [uncultured Litoreibacter sp.]